MKIRKHQELLRFYKVFHRSIVTLSTINIDKNETESLPYNKMKLSDLHSKLQTCSVFLRFFTPEVLISDGGGSDDIK